VVPNGVASKIPVCLPEQCQRGDALMLVSKDSFMATKYCDRLISDTLTGASTFVRTVFSPNSFMGISPLPDIPLAELANSSSKNMLVSVVNWRSHRKVRTLVEPVDGRNNIFAGIKTYWLVGLAGDLGQSICDWMIDHGARYVVLTSRSQRVAKEWTKKHKASGVVIVQLAG
jgi:hybrid polyketide synthase/nonribosomal peptide synthetase ACE1